MSLDVGNADTVDNDDGCHTVAVQYRDRVWEIDLRSEATTVARNSSSLAFELQAALNLSRRPVGLSLRVAPGADAVVCPLSLLIVCPSYIATTFQGMSWDPLLEGGGPDHPPGAPAEVTATVGQPPPVPSPCSTKFGLNRKGASEIGRAVPLHPGSPLKVIVPDYETSLMHGWGSTTSPSEGWGRPLTAPPGDHTRGIPTPRPSRREGMGRPMSATPSDKSFGMRRMRPGKREGYGRPKSAQPSDHSSSCSPAWRRGSPRGFRCEDYGRIDADLGDVFYREGRPATAPVVPVTSRRRASWNLRDGSIWCDRSGDRSRVESEERSVEALSEEHPEERFLMGDHLFGQRPSDRQDDGGNDGEIGNDTSATVGGRAHVVEEIREKASRDPLRQAWL